MRPTEMLKTQCQADWDAATTHVFCAELADGSLPLDKMRWYLAQDYQFIDQFARLLASAIAHAPTLQDAIPAAQFLAVITGPENTYFTRCFAELDIAPNQPAAPATADFQALMQEARISGRYELMLAVLVVAEWSYLSWAQPHEGQTADLPFWYAEWIDLHSGPAFAGVVAYLRTQLDQRWPHLTEDARQDVTNLFTRAVACERAFFDASYAAAALDDH